MKKLSLVLYALLALAISVTLTAGAKPVYSFFQSPVAQSEQADQPSQSGQTDQSPVATPTDTPIPPEPTDTPVPPAPTDTPAPPAESTAGAPEAAPTNTLAPETAPEPQDMTPTPVPLTNTQELTPIMPSAPQPAVEPPTQPAPAAPPEPAPAGGMVINEVKLVDTVVQWAAWIWMCLGVGAILFVLLLFPVLQMRGVHLKRNKER